MRAALEPEIKANKDRAVIEQITRLPEYCGADILLCYYPVKGEIDLRPLMERAISEGRRVALPKVSDGRMDFREYTGEFTAGAFGIPEPTGDEVKATARTLCVLPGYAYNGSFRLGYGGGYYDRFLADFDGTSVGAFYHDLTAHFPIEEHDVPADIIITEKGKL